MDSDKKEQESPALTALLASHSQYITSVPDEEIIENDRTDSSSVEFEEPSYDLIPRRADRWKLGSKIGSVSVKNHKEFRKLKYLHQSISTKENDLDSKTIKRNLHFASLLVQWFPEPLIDQAVAELHKTDRSKVVADEAVICRILGYIEALLRVSCRSIPWKTIFEINNELGMNIDKKDIAAAKFKAVSFNAFNDFYKKRGNKETFDVIRFHIVRLVADLEVSEVDQPKKRDILAFSRQFCKFLESKYLVPKDPEIYGHAIVEIACKKILKTRNLRTLKDPRLKKKLSTAIHYIKKQCKQS